VVTRQFLGKKTQATAGEGILLFYLIIFLLLQTRSRAISFSPRYLLPLFPALAIVSGAAIGRLWHSNANFIRTIGMIALSVLIILGLGNHIFHIGPSTVTDDVLLPEGRIANLQTSGRAAEVIINYLKQHKFIMPTAHISCSGEFCSKAGKPLSPVLRNSQWDQAVTPHTTGKFGRRKLLP